MSVTKKSLGLGTLSGKHVLVDKANTTVIVAAAVATAIVVFAIFASIELVNKISYQNKVIGHRNVAAEQLEENVESVEKIQVAYSSFDGSVESLIGTSDKNSKVVLDSLPSKYDFPAFATSLEFLILNAGLTIDSITGTDDEVAAEVSSINPVTIEIPFEISATGTYDQAVTLLGDIQRSIRPINITSIEVSAEGEGDQVSVSIIAKSYYQPTKELGVNEQVVKSDKKFKLETTTVTSGGSE